MLNNLAMARFREVLDKMPTDLSWREQVVLLIEKLSFDGIGVEVGTANGTYALEILRNTNIKELVCVDPYQSYESFNDALNFVDMEGMYQRAKDALGQFGARSKLLRDFSTDAAMKFNDDSLDFVYVDGNHQSKWVEADLYAWWPKVRSGGILFGDDCVDMDDSLRDSAGDVEIIYTRKPDGTPESYGNYGVYDALRKFCKKQELGFVLLGNQFAVPK
jgi:Methyltransferase domain